jgi:hypothetical protein
MLTERATVAMLKEVVGLLSDAIEHLATVQLMATSLAAKLGITQHMSVGLALALVDVTMSVSRLPEGALALRSSSLQAADAGERLAALSARATELLRTRAMLDQRFIPEMRPPLEELRHMAAALAAAPAVFPTLLSGDYRRAVTQYRRMSGGLISSTSLISPLDLP